MINLKLHNLQFSLFVLYADSAQICLKATRHNNSAMPPQNRQPQQHAIINYTQNHEELTTT